MSRTPKKAERVSQPIRKLGGQYKQDREKGLEMYADAVQEFSAASYSSRTRDFSDLTTYLGSRPGLRNSDYDFFRPDQAVPEKPKDIIAFARTAYRRIGLIRNAIDLMGDFACQGVRLVHKNRRGWKDSIMIGLIGSTASKFLKDFVICSSEKPMFP